MQTGDVLVYIQRFGGRLQESVISLESGPKNRMAHGLPGRGKSTAWARWSGVDCRDAP